METLLLFFFLGWIAAADVLVIGESNAVQQGCDQRAIQAMPAQAE